MPPFMPPRHSAGFVFLFYSIPGVPPLARLHARAIVCRPSAGAQKFRSLTRAICPTNSDLVFMFLIMSTRLQFVDVAAR